MSDKIEYSRLIMKRSDVTGVVPTIPTGTTLSTFTDTDLFVGEFFLNAADDVMWIRTDNGILPISLSGSTGTTIPTLTQVLYEGNNTNGFDVVISSGDTIQYQGIPSGITSTILGLDASGNTITTTGGGGTPDLSQVLAQGNTTNGYDIIVSTGDTITSPSGENEISLQDTDSLSLQSTYSLGGTNFRDQIKLRAPSPTDASVEIGSYDLTNNPYTKTEYRPISISDYSYDSGGAFVFTRLESTGFTIDLTNTTTGYFEVKGLLPGTATDLLGIDANNRVVPYTISASTDYYVTGGTFSTSGGTLTLERNDGNDVNITGFTANQGCFGITIDGAGSVITTGITGSIIVPYNCIIDCWGVVADQSGSIVVDVWKGSSPLSIPTGNTQSIAGSEKPTLSSQQINTDIDLTTWTKNLVFGDVLVFNVDSASTLTRATIQIKVIKL